MILLEEQHYTSNFLIGYSIRELNKPFNIDIREEWITKGSPLEIRMSYKLKYLDLLELYLISNGIFFRWLYSSGRVLGILIEPRYTDLNILLNDNIYFSQYENLRIN